MPTTRRSLLQALGLAMQMLRPGVQTRPHRHTSSSVHHVVRGQGATLIEGQRYDWSERDFFVVPPWAWHAHVNTSADEPAIVFQMNDVPVMQALGLYREEPGA